MTPAATVPTKCVRDNDLGAKGAFAKEGSFAKEGNFDAVGDFAEGWRRCPRNIGRGARATAPARLRRNDVLRAVPLGNNAGGSNQSDNVSAMPERDTGKAVVLGKIAFLGKVAAGVICQGWQHFQVWQLQRRSPFRRR
jgi:hypothetical protein